MTYVMTSILFRSVRRVVLALLASILALLSLAGGPGSAPPTQAQSVPDEADLFSFVSEITVAPKPVLMGSAQVAFDLSAVVPVNSAQVTISLPTWMNISAASPPGYAVTTGSQAWNQHLQYVTWSATPQVGITETFTVDFTAFNETGGLYEVIEGTVQGYGAGLYPNSTSTVFVKIGMTEPESDVTTLQPSLTSIIDHSTAEYQVKDQSGQWATVPAQSAPPLSALPLPKPVVSRIQFSAAPQSNTAVTLYWLIQNTIGSPITYSGTLAVPTGWTVVSGSPTIAGSLQPGGVAMPSIILMPGQIDQDWSLTGTVSVAGYPNYVILQEGGVSSNGPSWLGEQVVIMAPQGIPDDGGNGLAAAGALDGGRTTGLQQGGAVACPTCISPTGNFNGKRVTGRINMDDIPGASLRVVVQRLFHPGTIGMQPIVGFVGEARTDANGNYTVVFCFDDDDPWWIKVYVESTDLLKGQRSVTVRDEDGWFPVYRHTRGLFNIQSICELNVSYSISTKWADAFVIASAYAHDQRRFVEDNTNLDPYGGTFPFYAYWPYFEHNASRCWQDCRINKDHGRLFNLLAHEYGHHTHFATGGAFATRRFVEGWAIFQDHVARERGYVRGFNDGEELETKTHNGLVNGQTAIEGAAGYLWDLWDEVNTEPFDLQACLAAVPDETHVTFRQLLSRYGGAIDLSSLLGHNPGFYEQYPNKTTNFRAISFNHLVTNEQAASDACLVGP